MSRSASSDSANEGPTKVRRRKLREPGTDRQPAKQVFQADVADQLLYLGEVGRAVAQIPAHRHRDHLTREPVPRLARTMMPSSS